VQRGLQEQIPPPRKSIETPLERRWTICVERGGKWLIEQRPAKGRWAGMWQFTTVPARGERRSALPAVMVKSLLRIPTSSARRLQTIHHGLTHRRYQFEVFHCRALEADKSQGIWIELDRLDEYPMSRPQLKIAQILKDLACAVH